jgi:hypothetical protein
MLLARSSGAYGKLHEYSSRPRGFRRPKVAFILELRPRLVRSSAENEPHNTEIIHVEHWKPNRSES